MNKLILSLAILTAPLGACTTTDVLHSVPVIGNVCEAAQGTFIDEKAVLSAQVLYNVPAFTYRAADQRGQLTPAVKAAVKPKLVTLYRLLGIVKSAKGSVNCDLNAMKQLNAEVTALLPRGN